MFLPAPADIRHLPLSLLLLLDLQGLLLYASELLLEPAVLLGMREKGKELGSQCILELLLGLAVKLILGNALLVLQELVGVVEGWDRRWARGDYQVDVIMVMLIVF